MIKWNCHQVSSPLEKLKNIEYKKGPSKVLSGTVHDAIGRSTGTLEVHDTGNEPPNAQTPKRPNVSSPMFFHLHNIPHALYMEYLPTLALKITQMQVNIPYMDIWAWSITSMSVHQNSRWQCWNSRIGFVFGFPASCLGWPQVKYPLEIKLGNGIPSSNLT